MKSHTAAYTTDTNTLRHHTKAARTTPYYAIGACR